ncbi:MAG: hypothetical protein IJV30_11430 [Oscillospiraceae bacterium]|nr:hypothetical protein [Oscillospiraceae bacterium]
MTITDTLPAGLTVSKIMVGGEYNQDTFTPDVDSSSFTRTAGNNDMKDNVSSITATKSSSGTDIVVNLAVTDESNRSQFFREGTLLYVVVYATVDSSEFDAVSAESKSYTNHVSVTGNGKPLGEDDQTQVITLDSQSISKTTVKSAIGDLDSAQEEWEQYHYLSYGCSVCCCRRYCTE